MISFLICTSFNSGNRKTDKLTGYFPAIFPHLKASQKLHFSFLFEPSKSGMESCYGKNR